MTITTGWERNGMLDVIAVQLRAKWTDVRSSSRRRIGRRCRVGRTCKYCERQDQCWDKASHRASFVDGRPDKTPG